MKQVFKIRTFDRWARKVVSDLLLCQAASEIEQGLLEADLGGGVCKKRVAVPGRGKSGSARTLVAKKHKNAIFFLAGREKSRPGSDFSDKEVPRKSSRLDCRLQTLKNLMNCLRLKS